MKRNANRNPIFDTACVYQKFSKKPISINGLTISQYKMPIERAQYDLQFIITDFGNEVELTLEYATDLYEKPAVKEMIENYYKILEKVIENQYIRIEEIIIDIMKLPLKESFSK